MILLVWFQLPNQRIVCLLRSEVKMNCYYGYPQMNTMTSSYEEVRMEPVVCPKPRRLGLSNHHQSSINNHIRPLRCPIRYFSYFFFIFIFLNKNHVFLTILFLENQLPIWNWRFRSWGRTSWNHPSQG